MRRPTSLLAALLLGSAAGVVLTTGSATAAACAPGVGVTVVVGNSVSCDGDGGGDAASNFTDAGHSLTYVDSQPGMVCQVDGAPSTSCAKAPPANKYWGLFWSNGTSGTWKYSSLGVGSLNVPQGGSVAFVFQTGNSKTYPSVNPTAAAAPKPAAPTAKPKPKPAPKASSKPGATTAPKATTPSATSSAAAPSPTASTATPGPTPSAAATTDAAKDAAKDDPEELSALPVTPEEAELAEASNDSESGGSGALGFVAAGIGALLIAGMGATLWRRRAAGGPS